MSAPGMPLVSVVIPVLDEQDCIVECIRSVQAQDYPADRLEILVADGGSADKTRAVVASLQGEDRRIHLIDNPGRTQAAGLNLAIRQSRGDVIARLDGHATLPATHLSRCVALLEQTGVDSVGGAMDAIGRTTVGSAIARAWRSPFAAGGATYRYSTRQQVVDTVWLGCFRRSALERVGPYDERFPPHEDYELNCRIRASGGRILFSPDIPVRYIARPSWRALARQYFRYGRSKVRVARQTPAVIRPHHLAAPTLVAAIAVAPVLVINGRVRKQLLVVAAAYALASTAAAASVARGASPGVAIRIPLVFPIMHVTWGAGFWIGVME